MIISLKWLSDFIDVDIDAEKLSSLLTMSGIETKPVKCVSIDRNVVVVKILSIEKHPNADKLSICSVTDGQKNYKIVCGAKNMKVDDIVPLAKIGAKLPAGEIKKAVLRGVESEGMLCSESELKIGNDSSGILLLPPDVNLGVPINEYLNKDSYVETEVTINRGDCLSVFGIAREISAILNKKLKKEIGDYDIKVENIFPVVVENTKDCPRYVGFIIKNIKVGKSPQWLIDRIEGCGLRTINNVVDITNYILFEYGQPLHAFDIEKIKGKIVIRNAKKDEKILALDNKEYSLDEEMLVIADEKDPIAIAGVIGGEPTAVSENTKNVFLEVACFNPISIRKTSKKLGISTDSSYRFIRGVDMENISNIGMIASEMIKKNCSGEISGGMIDKYSNKKELIKIELDADRVNKILGIDISIDAIRDILSRLGFSCFLPASPMFSGGLPVPYLLSVTVPSHRNDVKTDFDLIEEIVRIFGYDKIKTSDKITFRTDIVLNKSEKVIDKVRNTAVSVGFYETINYNFISKDDFAVFTLAEGARKVANPISLEEPFLSISLIPRLVKTVVRNINRGNKDIRIFEIGKVFGEEEKTFFSGCILGSEYDWWKEKAVAVDFYFLKGFIERLFREIGVKSWEYKKSDKEMFQQNQSADILIENNNVGSFGLLNVEVIKKQDIKNDCLYVFELDLDKLICSAGFERKYVHIPKYPFIERDISIEVSQQYPAVEICNAIKEKASNIPVDVSVCDFYTGKQIKEGYKSLTFRIRFRLSDRTLKDEEVDVVVKKIVLQLENKFQTKLR
ncbi:MAG: phenylalanine--tRNA ligase subunit beta [Elusimicrobia bacterium]|nr:phenylalanine--tRNA ligase subunit beta [Elusimicrobiota bacterium]